MIGVPNLQRSSLNVYTIPILYKLAQYSESYSVVLGLVLKPDNGMRCRSCNRDRESVIHRLRQPASLQRRPIVFSGFSYRSNLEDNWAVVRWTVYLVTNLAHLHAVHNPLAKNDWTDQRNQLPAPHTHCCDHVHMSSRHPIPFARQLNRNEKYV